MSDELLPFALGVLIGGLARVRRGATPRGTRNAALAACLGGAGVTIASGEFAAAPLRVDAALALAGVGAVAAVASTRPVVTAARVRRAGGTV